MRPFWTILLGVLLLVGAGLIIWLPTPWNWVVGLLLLFKVSAGIALYRGMGRLGRPGRRSS